MTGATQWCVALGAALVAGLAFAARGHAEAPCGPFEPLASGPAAAPVVLAGVDTGLAPAQAGGAITTLPAPSAQDLAPPRGEALLALPKDASGAIPRDVGLAPGARIAASYWSPVLCATVARVVGPPDLEPAALVPGLPATAAVVPNSVYATAQAVLEPAPPPPASGPDPYRPLQYALDQLGVDRARGVSNGAGVRVAMLDSAPAAHRDLPPIELVAVEGAVAGRGAHGTLIAGVVSAIPHNAFGIEGVAPGVSLLAVPVCTPEGDSASDRCLLYDMLRGVDAAYAAAARVLNLSLVGPANPLLERSMARLDALGVLVVAAAGNEGTDEPRYPAAYASVIGVGASDRERRVYARSNRGLSAEIFAPGVEILSSVPGDSFAFGSGTSFAAAYVSGALGVLLGAGAEPVAARAALFRQSAAASEGQPVTSMAPLCDVLARLGRACPP
ncbi:MAG TPA: S8 family serine peptidase [Myxococcota bacterium]|nr:S8 family serine peptidase [Myxococcota bacterium]